MATSPELALVDALDVAPDVALARLAEEKGMAPERLRENLALHARKLAEVERLDRVKTVPGLRALARKTDFREPPKFDYGQENLFRLLMLESRALGASDIFISAGRPVTFKVQGRLYAGTTRNMDSREVLNMLFWSTQDANTAMRIASGLSANRRYEVIEQLPSGNRVRHGYRVNVVPTNHLGLTSPQITLRTIPRDPPLLHEIALPREIVDQFSPNNGVCYIAGTTGSGKSTTLASILRHILEADIEEVRISGHFMTVEEPIEFVFDNIKSTHSIVHQSGLPEHFSSFAAAIVEAMRRAPNLLYLGELRDHDSISAANEASRTGHPVWATVHSTRVSSTIPRLIARYPEGQRATAIFDIIDSTRFILAQRLVRDVDGKLFAIREYMEFDSAIRRSLYDLKEMGRVAVRLEELMEKHGHTFRSEMAEYVKQGRITKEAAEHVLRESD